MEGHKITGELSKYFSKLTQATANAAPQIFGSIIFLLIGLILAFLLQYITNKLIFGLDNFFNKATASNAKNQSHVKKMFAYILSKIVFWSVLIFSLYLCAQIFDWELLSHGVWRVISYLPNVAAILLILLGGYLLGGFVKQTMSHSLDSTEQDIRYFPLGTAAQLSIMVVVSIMAIEQLGINVSFLTQIAVVTVAALIAGGILTISLGARSLTANVIGAQYAKKACRIGQTIKINNIEGELLDITQTSLIVESNHGVCLIPARLFQEEVTFLSNFHGD
jgi:small-conductance mechanosensitive channel